MREGNRMSGAGRRRWIRLAALTACACIGFVVAVNLDGPIHRALHPDNQQQFIGDDMWWMLRSVGYLPLWIVLAAILLLVDRRPKSSALPAANPRPVRRGWLVLLVGVAAGAVNEVLKLLIRRQRPPTWEAWDGHYVFRAWTDAPLGTAGLGLPSGHASIAFAGMFLLCRMFPKAAPVFVVMAAGCAFTRLTSRGHFVSDVWVSVVLGWIIAALAWRLLSAWRGRISSAE